MSELQRHEDLEIVQDLHQQRRIWIWQRAAWMVMAVLVLAGILGLFGGGPFGRGSMTDPSGSLRVEYDRFGRREVESSLEVEVCSARAGLTQLWLSRDYVERAGVQQVSPTPDREVATPEGITYAVATESNGLPIRVTFRLNPARPGLLRGRVRVGDGPLLQFNEFLFP